MLADRDDEARLQLATQVSMETQQMTPLIKEELRLSIIKKRHASGQEDIKVEFKEAEKHELTAHEKLKRERRKEQNRRAARRCREKKKLQQCGKSQFFTDIIDQNSQLHAQVKRLRKEKTSLEDILHDHISSGCCRQVKLEIEADAVNPIINAASTVRPDGVYGNVGTVPVVNEGPPENALPSFSETFLEAVSPTSGNQDIFQFASAIPDMRTDNVTTRTWSGASDDVTPSDTLPEAIFDAMDPSANDDVFYDNDQFVAKKTTDATLTDLMDTWTQDQFILQGDTFMDLNSLDPNEP
ncbi:uncharacterized protein LOC124268851 [Haliotis rubra]|uniref:uncharacterized protein LOC124268851 n=1 Tax=Haliotis rubra TaxID=36100 RepID=UPI001EE4F903|nr:uncharacterized protein LOC124268851 [Haliotis rubra]XP_046559832.1 uncharacterized protein LOC124268851 [Haliotis rubra]